ncbi:hypothetical protein [Devosia aurantiaca]|uniref:Uncharacterized protein n=1 Tax=Devosia aurantiaca TaxID=2714858 RepID=A0A6M1SPU1_9HYPH|nr:hypothetical protein [Devosia aurantiaca]NGP18684.1 hypothetical protein [Devosia aurantiaca]
MDNYETTGATVELGDAMKAGFEAAMARIKALGLDPQANLVESIGQVDWDSWDASNENPNVLDSDGLDGLYEDDILPVAA